MKQHSKHREIKQVIKQDDFGTVYLIIKNDNKRRVKQIVKQIPILDSQYVANNQYSLLENPQESLPWREVEMSLFINTLPASKKRFFAKMINYRIIKCEATLSVVSMKTKLMSQQPTNKCLQIKYQHKGESLTPLVTEQRQTLHEIYNMIIQIIYALHVLKQAGYVHNDVHSGNITYQQQPGVLKIKNMELTPKYKYTLIDYGNNMHKKYRNEFAQQLAEELLQINWDVLYFVRQIILQVNVLQIRNRHNLPRNFKFKMEDIVEISLKYKDSWEKIKQTLYKKGDKYKTWIETFESGEIRKFYKNYKDKYPEMKSEGEHIINRTITQEIQILFSAYNRKGWLKMNEWKLTVPNLIPGKGIEYMILHLTDNTKIIQYMYHGIKNIKENELNASK